VAGIVDTYALDAIEQANTIRVSMAEEASGQSMMRASHARDCVGRSELLHDLRGIANHVFASQVADLEPQTTECGRLPKCDFPR
jgi:hypothetical protein